jgi:hypothetical protein
MFLIFQNFQYSSECMWINKAQFRQNGACGYVTKPLLITEAAGFHPAGTRGERGGGRERESEREREGEERERKRERERERERERGGRERGERGRERGERERERE